MSDQDRCSGTGHHIRSGEQNFVTREMAEIETEQLMIRQAILAQRIERLDTQVKQLVSEREDLQGRLRQQKLYLDSIEHSFAWRLIIAFKAIRERWLPAGTWRRRIFDSKKNSLRAFLQPKQPESVARENGLGPVYDFDQISGRRYDSELTNSPLISVVMPVYNARQKWLRPAIESVIKQTYTNWELCVVLNCSTVDHIRSVLEEYRAKDSRINLIVAESKGNISLAINNGLQAANGEFVVWLYCDDELHQSALYETVKLFDQNPELDVIYTDNDIVDAQGNRREFCFKPDWSPTYFLGFMYVGHLLCVRRSLALEAGGCNSRFDGIQDYEFMLRLSEKRDRIGHIPEILYHSRELRRTVLRWDSEESRISSLQQQAAQSYLDRQQIKAKASYGGSYRIVLVPLKRSSFPKISVIIPSKDAPELLEPCLKSVFTKSTYPNFEVVIGDNQTTDARALDIMQQYPVRRISYDAPFNFSRINNICAQQANGEFLLFLNNDTEVCTSDWIEQMIFYAEQPSIGAVGAVLIYPNHTIQHAGVVIGSGGTADHLARHFPENSHGYYGSLRCAHEISAVTAACLMVSKAVFELVGGFNEHFNTIYQDVDFCLKCRRLGKRNIVTPRSRLLHKESATRGHCDDLLDRALLLDLWEELIIKGDPYYNQNLDLKNLNYQPKFDTKI